MYKGEHLYNAWTIKDSLRVHSTPTVSQAGWKRTNLSCQQLKIFRPLLLILDGQLSLIIDFLELVKTSNTHPFTYKLFLHLHSYDMSKPKCSYMSYPDFIRFQACVSHYRNKAGKIICSIRDCHVSSSCRCINFGNFFAHCLYYRRNKHTHYASHIFHHRNAKNV